MVYNIIMKFNENNIIIENVLTEKEISSIYSALENTQNTFIMKLYAQTISDFDLPESVKEKIISYSEQISNENNLEISEYQFARYKKVIDEDSGEILLPNLIPHWDNSFLEPRLTFDYQISGNTTWPIVVEDKEFTLKNNSALTFSGTHQIHWRTPKEFNDDEYLDMIFFHLRKIDSDLIPEENDSIMSEKNEKYYNAYINRDTNA